MHNPFEREEFQAPLAEINMTPMVDVMLVLMVIFLVTAPMLKNSINLNLPQEQAKQISEEDSVEISIDRNGLYYFNEKIISEGELEKALANVAKNSHQQINLNADKDINYGKISHLLALMQSHNLNNVRFVTNP